MSNRFMEATEENSVRNLQRYLKQLSFFYPETVKDIIITGIYDTNTANAVLNLQRLNGIPANGSVDKRTWDTIFSEYRKSIDNNSTALGITPFYDTPANYVIKLGDSSPLIKIVEIILEELSLAYDFPENSITSNGIYDKSKSEAVRKFQLLNLIKPTGSIDKLTWERLADEYDILLRKNMTE